MIDAAGAVLDLRDGLRADVLAGSRARRGRGTGCRSDDRAIVSSTSPSGGGGARWHREVKAVAGGPDRVAGAAMAARRAAHPAQLDEPEPGTEVTLADLLELH